MNLLFKYQNIIDIFANKRVYLSLITIAIGLFLYIILRGVVVKYFNKKRAKTKLEKRRLTYYRLITNILKYVIIVIVIMIVLQINGFNVASLLTGLGVVSLVAGLALQDALKDIIMGFNLIADEYFSVGDVVKVGDVEGIIIELGLKATKIKDIKYGNIIVIANRNISSAVTLSNYCDIEIPLPYEENYGDIEALMKKIMKKMEGIKAISNIRFLGLNKFDSSAILYKIAFDCKPDERFQAKRDANKVVKEILEKEGIAIPYTQIDLHQK